MSQREQVAKRICARMAQGYADGEIGTPYPQWHDATESHREFCRELARVSQHPTEDDSKAVAKEEKIEKKAAKGKA